jgi:PPOX class probable F420-dependent enzyme
VINFGVALNMTVTLTDVAKQLLDGKNFATAATVNADGSPQTSVVWVKRDGDAVLFSTTAGRLKARNLARDPRISISIFDTANPYTACDIRGTAELIDDPDKTLPAELSLKYMGGPPPAESAEVKRVIVRVTPTKLTGFAGTTG